MITLGEISILWIPRWRIPSLHVHACTKTTQLTVPTYISARKAGIVMNLGRNLWIKGERMYPLQAFNDFLKIAWRNCAWWLS